MRVKDFIQKNLNKFGIQIVRYPNGFENIKLDYIRKKNIQYIVDAGASAGHYGNMMRKAGYKGHIESFEPLNDVFQKLEALAAIDSSWGANNFALGATNEVMEINVAGNSFSSSFLPMMHAHEAGAPASKYVSRQSVEIKRLDQILDSFLPNGEMFFLKMDVQGFEKQVIEGAEGVWSRIAGIEIEMSMVELYSGELLYHEMISYLGQLGFKLNYIQNGYTNVESGELYQIDGLFVKQN